MSGMFEFCHYPVYHLEVQYIQILAGDRVHDDIFVKKRAQVFTLTSQYFLRGLDGFLCVIGRDVIHSPFILIIYRLLIFYHFRDWINLEAGDAGTGHCCQV
jgi:hypothetical protein